jgi:hypothetical protein
MQFFSSDLEQHVLSTFGVVPMSMLNQSPLDSHLSGLEREFFLYTF